MLPLSNPRRNPLPSFLFLFLLPLPVTAIVATPSRPPSPLSLLLSDPDLFLLYLCSIDSSLCFRSLSLPMFLSRSLSLCTERERERSGERDREMTAERLHQTTIRCPRSNHNWRRQDSTTNDDDKIQPRTMPVMKRSTNDDDDALERPRTTVTMPEVDQEPATFFCCSFLFFYITNIVSATSPAPCWLCPASQRCWLMSDTVNPCLTRVMCMFVHVSDSCRTRKLAWIWCVHAS